MPVPEYDEGLKVEDSEVDNTEEIRRENREKRHKKRNPTKRDELSQLYQLDFAVIAHEKPIKTRRKYNARLLRPLERTTTITDEIILQRDPLLPKEDNKDDNIERLTSLTAPVSASKNHDIVDDVLILQEQESKADLDLEKLENDEQRSRSVARSRNNNLLRRMYSNTRNPSSDLRSIRSMRSVAVEVDLSYNALEIGSTEDLNEAQTRSIAEVEVQDIPRPPAKYNPEYFFWQQRRKPRRKKYRWEQVFFGTYRRRQSSEQVESEILSCT